MRASESLEVYFQTTLSGGYVAIGQDLAVLTRALLVGSTLGSRMRVHSTLTPRHLFLSAPNPTPGLGRDSREALAMDIGEDGSYSPLPPSTSRLRPMTSGDVEVFEDHPRARWFVRRLCGAATILFWIAVVLGVVAGINYKNAIDSGAHAQLVRQLLYVSSRLASGLYRESSVSLTQTRYGSDALALILFVGIALGTAWAYFKIPRVPGS